jgi:hypothetical protein
MKKVSTVTRMQGRNISKPRRSDWIWEIATVGTAWWMKQGR